MDTTNPKAGPYWDEISHAISHTSRTDLLAWAGSVPGLAGRAGWRRVTGFTGLVGGLYRVTRDGLGNMADAFEQKRLGDYCRQTAQDFSDACSEQARALGSLLQAVQENPAEVLPGLLFAGLGFYAGSGGLDGNGGIPDLDLLLGIGEHRSPFTHSIIAGIGFETLCLASLGLFTTIYYNLPDNHQPLWDKLHKQMEENGALFLLGGSAGIAFHLGVDAVIQPAALQDMPLSMPIEGHQTVLAMNALAEAGAAVQLKDFGKVAEHFDSFADAAAVARKHRGSKIRRAPDGNGFWLFHRGIN